MPKLPFEFRFSLGDAFLTYALRWALLIGYAAGKLGAALYRRQRQGAERPAEPSAFASRSGP